MMERILWRLAVDRDRFRCAVKDNQLRHKAPSDVFAQSSERKINVKTCTREN